MKNSFLLVANPLTHNPLLPEVFEANLGYLPCTDADRRAERMFMQFIHG